MEDRWSDYANLVHAKHLNIQTYDLGVELWNICENVIYSPSARGATEHATLQKNVFLLPHNFGTINAMTSRFVCGASRNNLGSFFFCWPRPFRVVFTFKCKNDTFRNINLWRKYLVLHFQRFRCIGEPPEVLLKFGANTPWHMGKTNHFQFHISGIPGTKNSVPPLIVMSEDPVLRRA